MTRPTTAPADPDGRIDPPSPEEWREALMSTVGEEEEQ